MPERAGKVNPAATVLPHPGARRRARERGGGPKPWARAGLPGAGSRRTGGGENRPLSSGAIPYGGKNCRLDVRPMALIANIEKIAF